MSRICAIYLALLRIPDLFPVYDPMLPVLENPMGTSMVEESGRPVSALGDVSGGWLVSALGCGAVCLVEILRLTKTPSNPVVLREDGLEEFVSD